MAKIKYYYDTETCKYEIIQTTGRDVIKNILSFLFISFALAVIILLTARNFLAHPKVLIQENRHAEIKEDIHHLQSRLNVLYQLSNTLSQREKDVYRQITQTYDNKSFILSKSKQDNGLSFEKSQYLDSTLYEQLANLHALNHRIKATIYNLTNAYRNIHSTAMQKESMLASIPAIYPVPQDECRFTSPFGYRNDPHGLGRRLHAGIDLAGPIGTPIYAAGEGTIKVAKRSRSGYGNQVEIDHGFGYETKYAHMKDFLVKSGQHVKRGELIGYLGRSGKSTGPHLHYEVKVNGSKVNPVPFLSKDLSAQELHVFLEQVNEE